MTVGAGLSVSVPVSVLDKGVGKGICKEERSCGVSLKVLATVIVVIVAGLRVLL